MILLPAGVTLFLCSLLFIISLSLLQGVYRLDIDSKEVWKIRVFIEEGLDTLQIKELGTSIESSIGISKIKAISAEEAKSDFILRFGKEWLDPLSENPLPASLEVWPIESYRNSYKLDQISRNIQRMPGVDEVITSALSLRLLEGKKWQVIIGASAIGLLLLGTLWLILRNSVRLSLMSRRLLVENMKYLGANYSFILFPFVFEALFLSVLSCGLAILVWYPFYWGIQSLFPFFSLTSAQILWVQLPVLLMVSAMAVNGTVRTVKQFLWFSETE